MPELLKSIGKFLTAFAGSWLTIMSGAISALATICVFFFSGFAQHSLVVLAVVSFLVAAFTIWKAQEDEVIKLKKRPYDHAVKVFVTTQLDSLGVSHRDLLRYLAICGEVWIENLQADCGVTGQVFNPVLTATAKTRLIDHEERPISGRSGTHLFWWIAPQYLPVIKDVLFPRRELAPQQWFQGQMIFPDD